MFYPTPPLFISYRHDDGGHGRLLHHHLAEAFSSEAVFFDRDSLIAGRRFRPELDQAVRAAPICLVVIGQHWFSEKNRQRLDEADDVTHSEIRVALECVAASNGAKNSYIVIPVLAGNAAIPPAADLPQDIASLFDAQAHTLEETRYDASVEALIKLISEYGILRARGSGKPLQHILDRLNIAATALQKGGRRVWCASQVVAAFGMEIVPARKSDTPVMATLDDIADLANSGENLVLFGDGGIGKTTALLALAENMQETQEMPGRVPLFVDASVWAATSLPLLEYISSLYPLQTEDISRKELLHCSEANRLTILLNGWNEIPMPGRTHCLSMIQLLMQTAQSVNIVMTTRGQNDTAGLVAPKTIRIKGLRWEGQKQLIRGDLDEVTASALVTRLALDPRLRLAARNPLVLTGIIQLQRDGNEDTQCLVDVLGAVVHQFEVDARRSIALQGPPLFGAQHTYLEAVACAMNRNQGATITSSQALAALQRAGEQLREVSQIGGGEFPQPNVVLNALCDQHLLVKDGEVVRFAHQRFQEYFAASLLFAQVTDAGCPPQAASPEILDAINWPFWTDALFLLAEKLAASPDQNKAKVSLIESARQIDLGFACELAGSALLKRQDAPALYDSIVAEIRAFWESPDQQVREYALCCMIDSRFEAFRDDLWKLLEAQDDQVRLETYRLRRSSFSAVQLGDEVTGRVLAWSPEKRVEFVHEVANNPENFKLVDHFANHDPSIKVRAASITALAWEFPGSDVALSAWKRAPDEVKIESQVLSALEDDLAEQIESVAVELIRLVEATTNPTVKLQLGLALPAVIGLRAGDAVLDALRCERNPPNEDRLLAFAHRYVPEQLNRLAKELALTRRGSDRWVRQTVATLPQEDRSTIFASAMDAPIIGTYESFDSLTVGSCADRQQTQRMVTESIKFAQAFQEHGKADESANARNNTIGRLLAHVRGDDLLSIVAELGEHADYAHSSDLLKLILQRMPSEIAQSSDETLWTPSKEQADELIRIFWHRQDDDQVPRQDIKSALCSIATQTSPHGYIEQVLEAVRCELDAWTAWERCGNEWRANPHERQRPPNMQNGFGLHSAIARCGFAALPGLVGLLSHPQSNHLLPDAIARILVAPWQQRREARFGMDRLDGAMAKMRRDAGKALQQPDSTLQAATDNSAAILASMLKAQFEAFDEAAPTHAKPMGPRRVVRPDGRLVTTIARIPSPVSQGVVGDALARGDLNEYAVVESLCSLVMQGAFIEDLRVVRLLEELCDQLELATWLHDSARIQHSQLHQLFYFVSPASLLSRPLLERLDGWMKSSYVGEIVRCLQQIGVPQAWDSLLHIARNSRLAANREGEVFRAIAAGICAETFLDFLNILRDDTFFDLSSSAWDMERAAGQIVQAMGGDAGRRTELLSICAASKNPMAEALACEVLQESKASELELFDFGLGMLEGRSLLRGRASVFEMFEKLFVSSEPHEDNGSYSISARSCNELRIELFRRALTCGLTATIARSILLTVEASRRELGRPTDEPRNPDTGLGKPFHAMLRSNLAVV